MILTSTITCPICGTASTETMPTDACQYFYDCAGCGKLLRPEPGDCCVFCSYGDMPCPPIQAVGGRDKRRSGSRTDGRAPTTVQGGGTTRLD
jgi:hypothetical protein